MSQALGTALVEALAVEPMPRRQMNLSGPSSLPGLPHPVASPLSQPRAPRVLPFTAAASDNSVSSCCSSWSPLDLVKQEESFKGVAGTEILEAGLDLLEKRLRRSFSGAIGCSGISHDDLFRPMYTTGRVYEAGR